MRNPTDFIKRNGLFLPAAHFANPLGRWQVCEDGCCEEINPGSCENFELPIGYIDKYATGAGDGTSWVDAFTTIAAGTASSYSRLWVKGYGQSDPYYEFPTIGTGKSLSGIGDFWLSGWILVSSGCLYNVKFTGTSLYGPLTVATNTVVYTKVFIDSSSLVNCGIDSITYDLSILTGYATTTTVLLFGFHTPSYSIDDTNYTNCYVDNVTYNNYPVGRTAIIHGFGTPYASTQDSFCNDCIVSNLSKTNSNPILRCFTGYGGSQMYVNNCVVDSISGTNCYGYYNVINSGSTCTSPPPSSGCGV